MPANVVHNARDEHLWKKAKAQAKKQGRTGDYAYVMGIYKKMKGKKSMSEEIDIKKDKQFRARARKAIFGNDLTKGFYTGNGDDWADKFQWGAGGPKMYVEALRCLKERRQLDATREAIYAKYDLPWEESEKLTGVERAKRSEARQADQKKLRGREKTCNKKCQELEDRLLDIRIKAAEEQVKVDAVRTKKGFVVDQKHDQKISNTIRTRSVDKPVKGDRPGATTNKQYNVKKAGSGNYTMGEHSSKLARESAKQAKIKPGGVGKAPKGEKTRKLKLSMSEREAELLDTMEKAIDIDVDAGIFGVADHGGQVGMRVQANLKCRGCTHYADHQSVCQVGLVPSVCGDGSHPVQGYAPAQPDRVAARNQTQLQSGRVVTSSQVNAGPNMNAGPEYRVEILGDSDLALAERMTLLKSLEPGQNPAELTKEFGFQVLPPQFAMVKGTMKMDELADAIGTTVDVVKTIASKLGNREDFAKFIKGKLPDIAMANGLDEAGIGRLYRAAVKSINSLTDRQWQAWKGLTFEGGVEDEDLARAIQQNGLLDVNALNHSVTVGHADPPAALPAPEPLQQYTSEPVHNFVGGSQHLADIISRR